MVKVGSIFDADGFLAKAIDKKFGEKFYINASLHSTNEIDEISTRAINSKADKPEKKRKEPIKRKAEPSDRLAKKSKKAQPEHISHYEPYVFLPTAEEQGRILIDANSRVLPPFPMLINQEDSDDDNKLPLTQFMKKPKLPAPEPFVPKPLGYEPS
nr:hypothetical protein Iba_chr14aCG6540 [Ipomoea batatas]